LKGFGIGGARGLQHSSLRSQALQLDITKLQAGELRFGLGAQAVEVVFFVVDVDAWHGVSGKKMIVVEFTCQIFVWLHWAIKKPA